MAALNSPNADLEQSLFKANLKEMKLRQRVTLVALVPVAVGVLWLVFSLYYVTQWQARVQEVEEREAKTQQRENEARQQVVDANAKRTEAETRAETSLAQEKAAKDSAADAQRRLIKARAEIGNLAPLLSEITAAKGMAAKLNNSEGLEAELTEMRKILGRTVGKTEAEIDKGLPEADRKSRVYLFVSDETQRDLAKSLLPTLAANGFDAVLAQNPGRRAEATEIRYFNEARDKAEAAKLQGLLVVQPALADCRLNPTTDPDHATGSRKFQVWLGKPAAAPK
ncbi:MAG: hypothetical protein DVB27_08245 [Verrucomicrobia bacterium]|nr:MAG: hypothetical protein DVB27_08245 [Verrucomicrobiota bacterium]